MRTLVRGAALAPLAVLIVLLVLTHAVADWLEHRDARDDARADHEGETHA